MALRVAILVQQIFWAVEIYTAVVAAQRVEGYSARPQARHHWRPKNLRADGTVNNGRTVVQVFRLARYWLFAFAAGSKAPIARLSLCAPMRSGNGPVGQSGNGPALLLCFQIRQHRLVVI